MLTRLSNFLSTYFLNITFRGSSRWRMTSDPLVAILPGFLRPSARGHKTRTLLFATWSALGHGRSCEFSLHKTGLAARSVPVLFLFQLFRELLHYYLQIFTSSLSCIETLIPWLMEPGGSMPHSQGLCNNSYPEPN